MSPRPWTEPPLFDPDWRPDDGAQLDMFTGAPADTDTPRLLPDEWTAPEGTA